MKVPTKVWPALLVFALFLLAHDARAGTLGVRDEARILSTSDVAALKADVARTPFDARLVVTTSYPDSGELGRYVGSLVVEPRMMVVGLDPEHHRVEVRFGTESGVARSDWTSVERAGNDAFRQGQWEQGVGAIFRAAAAAVPARGAGGVDAPVGAAQARPSLIGPGTILLIVGGIVALGIFLARRRSTDGYSGYAGPGPNYGGPPYGAGGYPGYGPGGGGGGMGPLGGGLIGAGLGGLAGYELGKAAGEREERERDGAGGPGDSSASVGGEDSFDAGGGGSSWDDGGGGFDGGGGDGGSGGGSDF